jgi:hypothetical protein
MRPIVAIFIMENNVKESRLVMITRKKKNEWVG